MQQPEALPGPSLDQWHRSAGEEEDGPGTVLLGVQDRRVPSLRFDHHLPPSPLLVLTDEQKSRIQAMKPMTKEEWDARQSVIRKVVDPETGRTRWAAPDGHFQEEGCGCCCGKAKEGRKVVSTDGTDGTVPPHCPK